MRRFALFVIALVAALAVSGAAGSGGSGQARWVITDLGTLRGDREASADAVNERGWVVGWSMVKPGHPAHAFVWRNGRMTDLGTVPGGAWTGAVAVNDRGDVVVEGGLRVFLWRGGRMIDLKMTLVSGVNRRGQIVGGVVTDLSAGRGRAVLWQDGKLRYLGPPTWRSSNAASINNKGEAVGSAYLKSRTAGGESRAFLWKHGRATLLPLLQGGHLAGAVSVNGSGQAVGWSENDVLVRRAVLWDNGRAIDLGMLPGFTHSATSGAAAINDLAQVVGTCQQPAWQGSAPKKQHGFLWEGGTLTDLGTLPGDVASGATGINEQGMIIGMSYKRRTFDGLVGYHAFVWQDGTMTRLPTLPGGSATGATDINEKSQIVGWATAKNGDGHAVLWTLRNG